MSRAGGYQSLPLDSPSSQLSESPDDIAALLSTYTAFQVSEVLRMLLAKRPELKPLCGECAIGRYRPNPTLGNRGESVREAAVGGKNPPKIPTKKEIGVPALDVADLNKEDLPILQFESPCYYASEANDTVHVSIMRIGDLRVPCEVNFATKDLSAKAGKHYIAVEKRLVFAAGHHVESVEVPLISDDVWDVTLGFQVILSHEKNCTLDCYHDTATVYKLDDDCFPSNVHEEYIHSDRLNDCPKFSLFWEYVKLNMKHPVIWQRSIKFAAVDQMHNVYAFSQLFLGVYMVDYVLNPHRPDEDLWFVHNKAMALISLIILDLAPFMALHWLDYMKCSGMGFGGNSRRWLQEALMRKFLVYSDESRAERRGAELIMAMTRDCPNLVSKGYGGVLKVMGEFGELMTVLVYQFLAPVVFGKPFSYLGFSPLLFYPVLMALFLHFRLESTIFHLDAANDSQDELVGHVDETTEIYDLIVDFNRQDLCVGNFQAKINGFNKTNKSANLLNLNSHYFPRYLAIGVKTIYMMIGGFKVINGEITLGMFLANVKIFNVIGKSWGAIYSVVLDICAVLPGLLNVTTAINMPTNLQTRLQLNTVRIESSELLERTDFQRRASTQNATQKEKFDNGGVWDSLPMVLKDVPFVYVTKFRGSGMRREKAINLNGTMEVKQGTFVHIVGPHGAGKTSLLKLLGGAAFPVINKMTEGARLFVPAHLKVLHVSDVLFFEGTLHDNLTFGVKYKDDATQSRLLEIMRTCGCDQDMIEHVIHAEKLDWNGFFSDTQCRRLMMVRTFIINPEVACLHKPFMHFDDCTTEFFVALIHNWIENKGIVESKRPAMRPRTIVVTRADTRYIDPDDAVFRVTATEGVRRVTMEEAQQMDKEDLLRGKAGYQKSMTTLLVSEKVARNRAAKKSSE